MAYMQSTSKIDAAACIDIHSYIKKGWDQINAPLRKIDFGTTIEESEDLLNNIQQFSHFFVLGCVMDRQVTSERAWSIPYKIGKEIGGFEFESFLSQSKEDLAKLFSRLNLHRFNHIMSSQIHEAIQSIHKHYYNNAANIWSNKPKSATVVRRFLEFQGVGIKIATMATNILVREFKIEMEDHSSIDISPDVQVRKFFELNGLVRLGASKEEIIYRARELCPEYPGIFDYLAWKWGREYRASTSKIN
jgi:endonuclease III